MTRAATPSSRVVIACGGTGGHLFPGLAVAEELILQGTSVTVMISPKEVDQRAVQGVRGIEIFTLPAVALQSGSRLSFFSSVARSARVCLREFRRCPPAAVLAMGGFTGAGPVIAARVLGLPVYLHESNTVPGRANRLLARFATTVFTGFPAAGARFRRGALHAGTPVRSQFSPAEEGGCRRLLGLDPDRPVVLIAGGSQGASGINDIMLRALPGARSLLPRWQWLHLTGAADEARVRAAYAAEGIPAQVHGFWDRMEIALGAASAAVMRSGASSMAELAAMRVPSVLIPYPHAADNHQFHNACAFESTGAAVLIEQRDLQPEHLLAALRPMVEDALVRQRMQSALGSWHRPDAARMISSHLLGRPLPSTFPVPEASSGTAPLQRAKALVA
ncbi:MAG: UDP-N-acetylglucosamine--N-acetylmuramyl-(pentapeptide) pyrophosphoryl-undecaprenol N-acetylglucosamine transferase [Verrucomicrobia bacterium]|jgi:UDP-N-acetylglucosamine--N-acetylmuramyl-(pentapeptide) pyrophosphoryl-undecaprenol N-acetylglucosamine transferase|nr:UDP-N-acetylglucosamine--N-acetylmuramyl-(pentapeptide) pyrophosphoryl-undecaprenol N-acetylglucosamine transferase [Verrucomicrobiota bacterium]